ncbi:OsmC family protein [Leptospira licerasiae]|uniref:OsmC-like protein n=1 Tax=Leptospira licerasiae str. MMD4847 TaxID=1049971 RepID=A0ABP2RAF8_9LEPT|nr:OsmC family protein [Leptospira licerasiae]EID99660.1 OsmC-like protein [Leptospira licerasiae serovar Varillal str. VAR 010]EJZ41512.1 OsmC-like protein [Leptospira licerasiae str. MMD4847]
MEETHFYQVHVKWEKERIGIASAPGLSSIQVATPPEFPGGHPGIWSPEHLFVASVNSCYMTTFLAIAKNSKLEYSSFESSANGKLEMLDGRYSITEIVLDAKIRIPNESDRAKALKIMEKSEKACLISNSIKTVVRLVMNVDIS